jgi:hypothetical protein
VRGSFRVLGTDELHTEAMKSFEFCCFLFHVASFD